MPDHIRAMFRDGVFYPETPMSLPNNIEVCLTVQEALPSPDVISPAVDEPEARRRILQGVAARMKSNPLPRTAPRFTRDELHERP